MFCAACGEPYDASRDECPVCGLAKGESPGDDGPDATAEPEETSPDQSAGAAGGSETGISDQSIGAGTLDPDRDGSDGQAVESAVTAEAADTDDSAASSQPTTTPDPGRTEPGPDEEYCSSCGEVIAEGADACPYCGTDRTSRDADTKKSPAVAVVLSLVIPGVGHVYALDIERGAQVFLAFFGAWVLTAATAGIGALAVIGVWLWGAYDAYSRTAELWT